MDIQAGDQAFWFKTRPRRERILVQVLEICKSRARVTFLDSEGMARVNMVSLESLEHPREEPVLSCAQDTKFAGPTFHYN